MRPNRIWTEAKILIVDDLEGNLRLLSRILAREGYTSLRTATEGTAALRMIEECSPDLVLLDLHMPEMEGDEVLRRIWAMLPNDSYLPVLILTADANPDTKREMLGLGVMDFVTKPFDATEVLLRVRNLLDARSLHLQMEERVRERTRSLREAHVEILERLAQAGEFRDDDTGLHAHRVGDIAAGIARALSLPDPLVELIRRAAPLHDIGKIAIPDTILLKPGLLTEEEWVTMKRHTTLGASILSNGRAELVRMAEQIALRHHERWDGSGYPDGLRGKEIPLAARIVAVADVFDALTHDRTYRPAWPLARVIGEIERGSGGQFDPDVVAAFLTWARYASYGNGSAEAEEAAINGSAAPRC